MRARPTRRGRDDTPILPPRLLALDLAAGSEHPAVGNDFTLGERRAEPPRAGHDDAAGPARAEGAPRRARLHHPLDEYGHGRPRRVDVVRAHVSERARRPET